MAFIVTVAVIIGMVVSNLHRLHLHC